MRATPTTVVTTLVIAACVGYAAARAVFPPRPSASEDELDDAPLAGPIVVSLEPAAPSPGSDGSAYLPVPELALPSTAPVAGSAAPTAQVAAAPLAAATRSPPVAPPRATAPRRHPSGVAPAVLRVETGDGGVASVTLDGEQKEAPGARFQHAAGKYLVVLADRGGSSHACTVELIEGRTRTLTVDMQSGACHLR